MTLAQIKAEAARLNAEGQRELIAYLVARQTDADEELRSLLAEKIDNNDLRQWVDLDDLSKSSSQ